MSQLLKIFSRQMPLKRMVSFSHYSYAIYDAIKSININCVEVHISNIHQRQEEFRKKSVTAGACIGQISGFGFYGYILAINALVNSI